MCSASVVGVSLQVLKEVGAGANRLPKYKDLKGIAAGTTTLLSLVVRGTETVVSGTFGLFATAMEL